MNKQGTMPLRFIFHNGTGPDWRKGKWRWFKSQAISKGIITWTWVLAAVYSIPKLFKKPPKGSTRWKEYTRAFKYNFSHVEIWFPNENGNFEGTSTPMKRGRIELDWEATETIYLGQCFSSTTRGGAKGVRFAPASEVLHHPERWMCQEHRVSEEKYQKMYAAAQGEVGKKYDYCGLFTGFFMLAWFLQNDLERYCSDICGWLGWLGSLLKKRFWIISPRRLAMVLGGEMKPVA